MPSAIFSPKPFFGVGSLDGVLRSNQALPSPSMTTTRLVSFDSFFIAAFIGISPLIVSDVKLEVVSKMFGCLFVQPMIKNATIKSNVVMFTMFL